MAADDVGKALVALRDRAVREQVRSGEAEVLGHLGLTAEELQLVQGAAQDDWDAEVAGFSATSGTLDALTYVGTNGVSQETAEQLDEVMGFDFGWAGAAGGKCEKCKKWDALFFDAASLTSTTRLGDPSLAANPGPLSDPSRLDPQGF